MFRHYVFSILVFLIVIVIMTFTPFVHIAMGLYPPRRGNLLQELRNTIERLEDKIEERADNLENKIDNLEGKVDTLESKILL